MSLPDILFITPSLPSPSGTGSMLRAAMSLEALRKHFRVHVLNLNVWSLGAGKLSFLTDRAASYAEVPAYAGDVNTSVLLEQHFPGILFVAIHTFKLVMARVTMGILAQWKGQRPYLVLDLDDDECARSASLLKVMEQEGDLQGLKRGKVDEMQLRMLEKMMAPRFDAICLAGVDDCTVLAARYPSVKVYHLPNAIDLPGDNSNSTAKKRNGHAARILFVGALYYAPNVDGICFFVERVLPLIQAKLETPVSVLVVGAEPLRRVFDLGQHRGVAVYPNVASVVPFYEEADLCIVPLRAGSGTRIKILEAFAYRRPVVSTRLGAEGLNVTDGQHLHIADGPEAFARMCAGLLENQEASDRMVESAYMWVSKNHAIANVEAAVKLIYQRVLTS